ncbi:tRNA (adenosine(37)-N6)-threonylcarbamoyltransferase complex transferase subunit TsaD [Ureaplasma sp. ES3154-GEN]|uniref:tRNA (adenosine(37)-N6)-threonylcarbamoyltransferase complex transferase subunit TsaD n=1 Tax=Ureaplasma sp. ES3154-GEN TaxID=2984844 RepID=UPI0021E6DFE7|nr:tRNA (adenosine(37)-N6)-threonylcarbamoyltransferase complex transferase subunit TsaD [Ureaplasma sp. ES3154-GEN]MCV3743279.1 tRNA (adenosine(37)-N6)-threonylcarbamoyltransferase complex transferase subunit TsaD [Ureaplasma sp. ES3154-GEN]
MTNDLYILSIETSCDETSMAVFKNNQLLAHNITTSMQVQADYGGVVPEVASRYHEQNIVLVFRTVIKQAGINPNQLTHIAYTAFPGLPGCLHVGKVFADLISRIYRAELVKINHLHAHLFSAGIDQPIKFPFLGLVVSGGETSIYHVKDYDDIEIINQTQDDAVGEVYDKIARILGWNYPGGPIIDKHYDPEEADLMLVKHPKPEQMFSFSGLKTAFINYVHNLRQKKRDVNKVQVGSSLQKYIVDELCLKLEYYLQRYNLNRIYLGGGVSANKLLRTRIKTLANEVYIPQLLYTTDNAAMIGIYAYFLIKNNKKSVLIKINEDLCAWKKNKNN